MTNKFFSALFLLLTAFVFNSCKKDKAGYGNIYVMLTDSPATYQKVNVNIVQVSVHLVPISGKAEWIDLPTKSGVYDLLQLQNGVDTTIVATNQLAAGKITEMRLLLGSNNSIMADSVVYPLTVPSGTQTGIKLPGPINVTANTTVQVLLDFVASQSVVASGSGSYQLKPVIQVL